MVCGNNNTEEISATCVREQAVGVQQTWERWGRQARCCDIWKRGRADAGNSEAEVFQAEVGAARLALEPRADAITSHARGG